MPEDLACMQTASETKEQQVKQYLVTNGDQYSYVIFGLYSTYELAEAHLRLELEMAKISKRLRQDMTIEEIELSSEIPPIYYEYALNEQGFYESPHIHVGHSLPETYVATGPRRTFGYAYGRTREEAKTKLEVAIAAR